MKLSLKICLLTILLALTGISLSAQADTPGSMGQRGHHSRFFDKEMAANFENLRLLKLLETVDLTEEQSEKFIPLFHGLRKDLQGLRQERHELIERLSDIIDQPRNEAEIREILEGIKKNKTAFETRSNKFIDDCDGILSMAQLGKLVLFQERFEKQILKTIRNWRRGGSMDFKKKKQGKI